MAEVAKPTREDWLRVREAAAGQIKELRVRDAPVPVIAMAERAGLSILYADFPDADQVSGFIDARTSSIYVNASDAPTRQLFTIAHELGHWLLHRPQVIEGRQYRVLTKQSLDAPKPPIEEEADGFAADLLAPKFLLDRYYRDAVVRPSRQSLARIFGVSDEMIKYRLRNLYGD